MTSREEEPRGASLFDDSGYGSPADSTPTTSLRGYEDLDEPDDRLEDDRPANAWHGGLDFGLLVLRLALGGTMGAHGLQKLFGLFNGPGIDGFAKVLGGFGFTSQTTLLSWVTGIAELGGGVLLVLGLFTPIGAAAILGVTVNIVYVKFSSGFFTGPAKGYEYELMLAAVAFALLFTGAGRISLDKNTPWRRKPMPFAITGVVLAGACSAVVLVLFR